MNVPLSVILETLLKHHPVENHVPADEKRVYKGVSMMPDPPHELISSLLHVSLLSVAVQAGGIGDGQTCVCIRNRPRDALETAEVLRGLIIVETLYTMEYVFHEVHAIFLALSEWER